MKSWIGIRPPHVPSRWLVLILGFGLLGTTLRVVSQECMRWVQRLDVGGPGPQGRHCMAYDRDRGVTLLFTTDFSADLWQYDGIQWLKLRVTGPRPADRLDAALAYDPVRRVVVLSGGIGRGAEHPLADVWTFALTAPGEGRWTRTSDFPRATYDVSDHIEESGGRSNHRMVFDGSRGELIAYGGDADMSRYYVKDFAYGTFSSFSRFAWTGNDWTQTVVNRGDVFVAVSDFAMVFDDLRRRVVVHGGRRKVVVKGETVVFGYDGLSEVGTNDLTRLSTGAGRFAHRMVHDTRRDRYVVFGGAAFLGGENPAGASQVEASRPYFEFDPRQPGFPQIVPTSSGSIPRPRVYHDMVYDERRGVTVMFGGVANPANPISDVTQSETWELRPLLDLFKQPPAQLETCFDYLTGRLAPPLTLSAEASSPGGVMYQWRHRSDGVTELDKPTSNPARLLDASLSHGTWDVVVTDQCGNSVTSSPCVVKVYTSPTIREEPTAQHVCPGDPLETRVVAGADSLNRLAESGVAGDPERPVRYQWFRVDLDRSGGPGGIAGAGAVPGATGPTLRFGSFQPSDNGFYRCRLSNDCGATFSAPVELTAGVWIRRDPATTTNEVCSLVDLDVLASGKGPLRYQWRRNGEPLSTEPGRITGVTNATLTFTSLRYLDDAAYDCVVSDACNSVISRVCGIGVVPNPPFLLIETNGPSARERHGLVYDPSRGVSVLFGGRGNGRTVSEAFPQDTWEYNGTNWVRRTPANAPAGRIGFGMAFDRHRARVVLFGGMTNDASGRSNPSGETWEYDGTDWTQRFPSAAPAPRHNLALFYDPVRRVTTLYGGDTLLANPRAGDIWTWDGTNWTQREVIGDRPLFASIYGSPPQPQMVWDDRRGYAVLPPQENNVPGGAHLTWTWNGTNWTAIPTPFLGFGVSPAQTFSGMGLVYDRYRGEVIYWSGSGFDQELVWRWNGSRWRRDDITAFVGFHLNAAAAYDERRNSVVLFGGNLSSAAPVDISLRGYSARTFERVLADDPVLLRQPEVVDDPVTGRLLVRVVAAGAPPLRYEWQRNGVKILEAFPFTGTSNAVLQVERALIADAGFYRCVVRGKCGETVGRATTLAGALERPGPVLALTTAPVLGQPGISLTWSGPEAVLERAPAPVGPWTPVVGATSPFAPPLAGPAGYFRIRGP